MTIYPMQGRGPYYTNCYLVIGDEPCAAGQRAAVLIDASVTPEQVEKQLQRYDAQLQAILLTHGHKDHREQLSKLKRAFAVPVWLDAADARHFSISADCGYADALINIGDLSLQPVAAPGHTPGSTVLLCGQVMFSGDTLFSGSVGRTDLPGGDTAQLMRSLHKLCLNCAEDLQVLPGHGEATTFETERQINPWLRAAQKEAFI